MTIIKSGTGIYIGQDFTRLAADTPIEITGRAGSQIYGRIQGDPQHARGFMRAAQVSVRVDSRFVVEG